MTDLKHCVRVDQAPVSSNDFHPRNFINHISVNVYVTNIGHIFVLNALMKLDLEQEVGNVDLYGFAKLGSNVNHFV